MNKTFLMALLLTTLAGLSTTIGSLLIFVFKDPTPNFLSFTLGFSSGVMIIVSFVELLHVSINTLGFVKANAGFFIAFLVMFLLDYFIPHDYIGQVDRSEKKTKNSRMLKTGMFIAIGIMIHNFPEGMATFISALKDIKFGIAIAIAIGLHNISEGLAVSVPIYAATGSRKKAFWWSFFSGMSEPLGAIIAGIFIYPFLTPTFFAWSFAVIAGIMVYISFDELMPLSRSCGAVSMFR